LGDVQRILADNNLPTEDLSEVDLNHFFGCGEPSNPKGVIGMEVHGTDALLRSLAVDSDVQGQGCGSSLYQQLERHSIIKQTKEYSGLCPDSATLMRKNL